MTIRILTGDCRTVLATLPDESVHCVVTSPPYFGLRDYGVAGQIGLEASPEAFVAAIVAVFREVRRVLRRDGTLWLNLGDSYASTAPGTKNSPQTKGSKTAAAQWANYRPDLRAHGIKPKDLIGIPWRVALALQADGWWLRQDIIWHKPNQMPERVQDRCTKSHEYLFLLSRSEKYNFDHLAIKECAADDKYRNKRSVWVVPTTPYRAAHFATFPPDLIVDCIKAGSPFGGTVLDPFGGAGTTGLVAARHGRDAILIELNPAYADMARDRIARDSGMFSSVTTGDAA